MKRWYILLLICICDCCDVLALGPGENDCRLTFTSTPCLQQWQRDGAQWISETSIPMNLLLNLSSAWQISVAMDRASVAAANHTGFTGFSDTQLAARYCLQDQNMSFKLGVNLPYGKKEYTYEELETCLLLSQSLFAFKNPNLGQGWIVAPSLLWAKSVSDYIVLGVGLSCQYKGAYYPVYHMEAYDPGEEVACTMGADIRLSDKAWLNADVLYTYSRKDKIGDQTVFAGGSRIAVHSRMVCYLGFNQLTLWCSYRAREKNQIIIGNRSFSQRDMIHPDHFSASAQYTARLAQPCKAFMMISYDHYAKTSELYSNTDLLGAGLGGAMQLSKSLSLLGRVIYRTCRLQDNARVTGVDGSAGFSITW